MWSDCRGLWRRVGWRLGALLEIGPALNHPNAQSAALSRTYKRTWTRPEREQNGGRQENHITNSEREPRIKRT